MIIHKKKIIIISIILACLCVVAIPLWVLGVPGIEGDYAMVWTLGFRILVWYPLLTILNYLVFFLIGKFHSGPVFSGNLFLSIQSFLILISLAFIGFIIYIMP